ncbi:hypothetical protein HG430_000275 [Candidatus Gracilibacteria bacterium]|nr:hypothetical protein [Candidatus Gracilibacteria bacterium]
MNIDALNGLINSILNGFRCHNCNSNVEKKNIDIKSVHGSSVLLDIFCENCKSHSMVKSEVLSVDLSKHLNILKNSLEKLEAKEKSLTISDEEIKKLDKDLKKDNLNVSDLFN